MKPAAAFSASLLGSVLALPVCGETLHMRINGVSTELTHGVGGEGSRILAQREAELRGAVPQRLPTGGWDVQSRLEASRSITLQRRGAGDSLEVMYSVIDVAQSPRRPRRVPLILPAGVETGATIETLGDSPSTQWSLRSSRALPDVLREIRVSAAAHGWRVSVDGADGLTLVRRAERLRLAAGGDGSKRTRLTLIAWSVR